MPDGDTRGQGALGPLQVQGSALAAGGDLALKKGRRTKTPSSQPPLPIPPPPNRAQNRAAHDAGEARREIKSGGFYFSSRRSPKGKARALSAGDSAGLFQKNKAPSILSAMGKPDFSGAWRLLLLGGRHIAFSLSGSGAVCQWHTSSTDRSGSVDRVRTVSTGDLPPAPCNLCKR